MQSEIDKQRLLDLMQTEYEFLERTLELLTPEQMLIPDVEGWWSVKDTIAHLSLWMRCLLAWFEASQQGSREIPPKEGYTWAEIDKLNDDTSAADKDHSLEDVLEEFHLVYSQAVELVESLSEEELFNKDFIAGLDYLPCQAIMDTTSNHFFKHAKPMREWISTL